ncbi:amino acid adenylation domain-containing protein [Kitasatospora sp. NPDC059599]|uniref:amino acid adenylation domain-containing protein n=1 Tax=Kitasatospora sp. NPDC059599 TaxID=3346880 RepID=UPI00368DC466
MNSPLTEPSPAEPTGPPGPGHPAGAPASAAPAGAPASADAAERRRALLDSLLRGSARPAGSPATTTASVSAEAVIARVPRDRPLPLSFAQQRLWLLDRLRPGTAEYVLPVGWELRGPLDVTALRRALAEVSARHEVLRTRYLEVDGEPRQLPLAEAAPEFELLDLTALPADHAQDRLGALVEGLARTPFDLAVGTPMRARLVRLGDDHHVLVLAFHHIAFDGSSTAVLAAELGALYPAFAEGRPSPSAPPAVQYADWAHWQREAHAASATTDRLDYWRRKLAGSTALELPADLPRPPVFDPAGAILPFTVPAATVNALTAWGRTRGATPFVLLLAAFKLLLARHAGRDDVTVGAPAAGRTRPETRDLLGFFVDTLVLRTDLSGAPTFEEAVGRVRETALGAFAHQDVPFERLVDELAAERDLSRNPLFQVMFVYNGAGAGTEFGGAGLRATPYATPWHSAKFDLTLHLTEQPDGSLSGVVEYATALFTPERAAVLAEHFTALLDTVTRDPGAVVTGAALFSPEERARLERWNETDVRHPEGEVLHRLVDRQAERTPTAVAVRFEDEHLDYRELCSRADALARRLRALGVGPESIVAVCLNRGLELPVALLAVLKAGGAYLPLDPGYPAERLGHMLTDSAAPVVLTTAELAAALPPHRARVLLPDGGRPGAPADAQDGPDSPDSTDIPDGPDGPYSADGPDGTDPAVDPMHPAYVIYTSGSTGRPKGVVTTHRGIVNRLRWMQDAYRLTEADRVLQKTPYSFDVSVWELFWPLITGATLVMARPDGHRDPAYLARTIADQGVTALHFVPAMLRAFLATVPADAPAGTPEAAPGTPAAGLRLVLCSGEALPDDLAEACHRHAVTGGAELHNLYGPTEAAIDVTAGPCRPGERVTIGTAIANTRVHVLDDDLAPVPVDVPGRLCLAGVQLARGYLNRPALTAERFVPDPDPGNPGGRLYLTGDLARRNPDGTLTYQGRGDHQVKLHGHRVELGEIESALRTHPLVADAVAALYGPPGGLRLAVHVVPADPAAAPAPAALQDHLRRSLPEHMVPTAWTSLVRLPVTPNGKLDRAALPDPVPQAATGYVPPRTPVEQVIARAWGTALELDRVGVHDTFFDLGGDSIRAIRAVGRLREQGLDVSVQDVFRHRSVARLAEAVAPRGASRPAAATAPFDLLDPADRDALPDGLTDAYPLSQVQAGMAYEMLAGAARGMYVNVLSYPVREDDGFSATALRAAADLLAARHEILRTSVDLSGYGEPLQLVHAQAGVPVAVHDLRGLTPERVRAELAAATAREQSTAFDLAAPPLLRLVAHRLDDRQWRLTVVYAHAILDGWSQNSLVPELLGYYRALRDGRDPAPPAPPATRFADTIALERRSLASAEDREFWRGRVARHAPWRLPEGWSAPERHRADDADGAVHRVARVGFADLLPGLRALATEAGVPLKSVLFAAHLTVLGLFGGGTDGPAAFTSGLVCNARPETADGDRVRGMFLNTVPFPVVLNAAGWPDLARSVFAEETALWPHRHHPLPAMQRAWGQDTPLVDVFFNHTDMHVLADEGIEPDDVEDRTPNEFGLSVSTEPGALVLEAAADRIGAGELALLARTYRHVLAGLVADPTADPRAVTLPPADRSALLPAGPAVTGTQDGPTVLDLFHRQADRTPDAVALVCGAERIDYAGLRSRANRLAHHLRALGVGPGTVVGLLLDRGPDLLTAVLGVLGSGAAYLPVDPALPEDRIRYLFDDCASPVVVTDTARSARLAGDGRAGGRRLVLTDAHRAEIAARPDTAPALPADPAALAYVIHTSGSTGRPKGVMVTHGGLAGFLTAMADQVPLRPGTAVAALTTVSFDPSVLELYLPLLAGATVVLADTEEARDPLRMAELLDRTGPAVVQATPVTLRMLLDGGWSAPAGLLVLSGGERLPADLLGRLTAGGARVRDLYGPTETTVWATVTRPAAEPGEPRWSVLANTRLYVLDGRLEPAPDGVVGEIHLGGSGLARGYLGRPGTTAGAFVPDPYGATPGARMYRTGDLGRRRPDGSLELLGRADHQVKIRGHRIEPGEIEAALLARPEVRAAVVQPVTLPTGEVELVAHLEPVPGTVVPEHGALRDHLLTTLPDYMVPAAFAVLDALPLTPSGKVDRRNLPGVGLGSAEKEFVEPRDEAERAVAAAWREILGHARIGVHDNFFTLGGHSVLATRIALRLRESTGRDVPVRAVFDRATVAALAAALPGYPEAAAVAALPLLGARRARRGGAR